MKVQLALGACRLRCAVTSLPAGSGRPPTQHSAAPGALCKRSVEASHPSQASCSITDTTEGKQANREASDVLKFTQSQIIEGAVIHGSGL